MPSVPSTRRPRKPLRRHALRLESLEHRLTPATITWDGGLTGLGTDWNDPANWVGDVLPGAADDAVVGAAFAGQTLTSSVNVTVQSVSSEATIENLAGAFDVASASTIRNLTLSGGALTGPGAVTVPGTLTWTAGNLAGGPASKLVLTVGATGSITANHLKLLGRTLENSGTLTYSGSGVQFGTNFVEIGVLSNLAGGTLNLVGDGDLTPNFVDPTHAIQNAGTVNRSGSGTTTLGVALTNAGTVNVTAGTLGLEGGGSSSGTVNLSGGTALQVAADLFTLPAGTSVTGSGSVLLSGGTLHIAANLTVPGLAQTGGTLTGSGSVTVTGAFSWTAGTMNGGAAVKTILAAGASGTVTGADAKFLGRTLENGGTLTYSGSNLSFGTSGIESGVLSNLTGGTLTLAGDGDLTASDGGANLLSNDGVLNRSGTGSTDVFVPVTSNGSVNVQAGTLRLKVGGSGGGTFSASAGATLDFGGGTFALTATSAVTGAGTVAFSEGTTTVAGTFTPAATTISGALADFAAPATTGTLTLSAGALTGPGTVTVTNTLAWSGGNLAGGAAHKVILPAGSTGTITTANNKFLGRTLENSGTLTYSGSGLAFGTGFSETGTLRNLAGGTLNLSGDGDLPYNFFDNTHLVSNAGTLNRSGTGTTTVGVPFTNSGTVNVTAGALSLDGNGSSAGAFTVAAGAALQVAADTYTLLPGVSVSGSGEVRLAGGTLVVVPNLTVPGLAQTGGTLTGSGSVTVTGAFSWTAGTMNGGTSVKTILAAGATGSITTATNKNLARTLENSGTLTYSGSNLLFGTEASPDAVVNNLAGGTLNLVGDGNFASTVGGLRVFTNAGTVNRSGAGTATTLAVTYTNTGTVNVLEGTLCLVTSGTSSGAFTVSAGATLKYGNASHTLAAASGAGTVEFFNGDVTVSGAFTPGQIRINGGLAVFTGTATVTTGTLTLSDGALTGPGTVTVTNTLAWSGGNLAGGAAHKVVLTAGSTGSITTGNMKVLGRTLENSGNLTYSGSGLLFGTSFSETGTLSNRAGGTLNLSGDGDIGPNFFDNAHLIHNAGTLNRTGTGTTTSLAVPVTNAGTLNVQEGTLGLDYGTTNYDTATDVLTGGTYLVQGTLRIPGLELATNRASLTLNGTASALVDGANLNGLANFTTNAADGSITLLNGRSLTTPAFTSAGSVLISAGTTLATSAGDYTQTGGTTTVNGTLDPAGGASLQGGVLNGIGAILGATTDAGQVAPGNSLGILTVNGNYSQTGSLAIEINGPAVGTGYDRLAVNGAVTLSGPLQATAGYAFASGTTFIILQNDGTDAVSGTFTGLLEGAYRTFPGGQRARISYAGGTGNDVVLTALPANVAPTNLALAGSSVAENRPAGTVVGTLSATDANVGDTHTFELVAGTGSEENALFTISGNQLLTAAPYNFEALATLRLRVQARDAGGLTFQKALTVSVTNVIEVTGFDVQRGATQRSYIRYLDITFASAADATLYTSTGSRALTRADLNGNNPLAVGTGSQSRSGNVVTLNFGVQGIGGSRNSATGDGYYQLTLTAGTFTRSFNFYRLFGDVNGDRQVSDTDVSLISAGLGGTNLNLDVNGDGNVNMTDYNHAFAQRGRQIAAGLPLDD